MAAALTVAGALTVAAGWSVGAGSRPDPPARVGEAAADASTTWRWSLPPGFPEPQVPADNPMSVAKVELGRRLFFDPRLSRGDAISCATCHRPELAFTDGRARPEGVTGVLHPRSAMSLVNVAYAETLGWDDPNVTRLEDQLLTPLFGHDPVEMGMQRDAVALDRFRQDADVSRLFDAAFTGPLTGLGHASSGDPVTWDHVAQAIAAYERTLIFGDTAFDRTWHRGDEGALTPAARRGMRLFFGNRLACGHCHGGFNLSGPTRHVGSTPRPPIFHNTGLYNLDGRYPSDNPGLARHTAQPADDGRFKTPTLRNVTRTAPYFHDGSAATLDDVLDHYAAGGRRLEAGRYAGDGSQHPNRDPLVRGFLLTAQERADLLAFLAALEDSAF
ncbi:MAG: MbnH family di-heme enzyme [Acidobacteriota bacterium]